MKEQLNLVKILKDCPKGTKFYSSYLGKNVIFIEIYDNHIKCEYSSQINSLNCSIQFRKDGSLYPEGECMVFPSKDQRDWSKWQRPFIDGDIVFCYDTIAIFKEWGDETLFRTYVIKYLCSDSLIDINTPLFGKGIRKEIRFATEKEKEQLFQTIKDHGYKWNNITKTLEKLIVPKFKVGDIIQDKNNYKVKITEVNIEDELYGYESLIAHGIGGFSFNEQDNWKLIPNKFDPKTLKPFDKVLVRDIGCNMCWRIQFFESIHECNKNYPFMCLGSKLYSFCIPYNDDTKHLIEKSEEAPEFYRYWEN